MSKKFYKQELSIGNHFKSKLLFKNWYQFGLKFIQLQVNLNKLKSFNQNNVIEGLFLLELLSSLKSAITYYKKMYQAVNVQISNILRKINIFYFLFLFKIFYFPVMRRRKEPIFFNFTESGVSMITMKNINLLPFLPDIFFKWTTPINCFFISKINNFKDSVLFLKYWNFIF